MDNLLVEFNKSSPVSQNILSPADFDKQLRKYLANQFPRSLRSGPGNLDIERAAREAGCPTLDTPTPFVTHCENEVHRRIKRTFTKSHRRMYNRIILGLKLPGRYYFLTLTSTPASPPIRKSYKLFSQWLRRKRPGITWLHCITCEGHGVAHIVLRLSPRMKNLDIKEVRAYWENLTGARQVNIKRVRNCHKNDLADYLVNQKLKKGMAREFAYQGSSIMSWHASAGWLPKGYTKAFARLWLKIMDAPDHIREKEISISLNRAWDAEKKELKKK